MRKSLLTLLAVALLFGLSSSVYSEEINTDVNGDGVVNILDLVRVASAFGQPVSDENAAADVNGDGEINILDLVAVANDFGTFRVPTEPSEEPGSITNEEVVSEPVAPQLENMQDIFVVGITLPRTGHLAAVGEIMRQGFDHAFKQINTESDISLEYILVDDKGTAEGAVAAFEALIHKQGVSVILGPSSSSSARAAFPIAQENGVVAISATAGASGLGAIGDFVFRTALTTDVVIPKGVKATQVKLGYQRVATLYDEDDLFSSDHDAALQLALDDNGVEVLGTQTYKTGTTDFTAQLTHIKALNPDALFVSALPPEKPAILIQARELGISVPILISSFTEVEVEAAGTAAEGAITFTGWLPTAETPGNQAFVEQYREAYGIAPNAFAAAAYACVHVFAEALKHAENTDVQSIRDALARIQNLDTILGKFSFNVDGDAVYEPNILIVRDGVLQSFTEYDPEPDKLIYSVGDTIPSLPAHRFWFPHFLSRCRFISGLLGYRIEIFPGGTFIYNDVTYTSSEGGVIENQKVISGSVEAQTGELSDVEN